MSLHNPMYSTPYGQCPSCSLSPSSPPLLRDLHLRKTYSFTSQNRQFWQFFGSWGLAQWSTPGIAFVNIPGRCWLTCTCCSNRSQSTYWLPGFAVLWCADSSEPLPLCSGTVFPFLLELSPDPIMSNSTGFPGKQIALCESCHKAGIW